MHKRHFLTFLILISSTFAFSQSVFKPGYYINLSGDTVRGLVDYRGEMRDSKRCTFKKDENAEAQIFEPQDIAAYRYTDGKFYVSKKFTIKGEEKHLFLEYIINGIADLFYYYDSQGEHYLIESKNGTVTELTDEKRNVDIDGKKGITRSKRYIGIMKAVFSDSKDIQPLIEKSEMTHESLTKVVKTYHDYVCNGEKCIIYEKKLPPLRARLSVNAGFSTTELKFNDGGDFSLFRMDRSYSPVVGIAIHLIFPRVNERYTVQINSDFSRGDYYGYSQQTNSVITYCDLNIHSSLITNSLLFKYTYPKGKIQPYIGIGPALMLVLACDARIYQETELFSNIECSDTDVFPFESSPVGGVVELGTNAQLTKKIGLQTGFRYSYLIGTTVLGPQFQTLSFVANFKF
jgi:hypothetical protein